MSRNVHKHKISVFSRLVAVVFVSYLSLLACSASPPRQTSSEDVEVPITVHAGQTYPMAFKGIVINVPTGKEIGSYKDGLLKTKRYSNYWDSGVSVGWAEFSMVALGKLRKAGYSILGGQSQPFGQGEAEQATFQLTGTISGIRYDTYGDLAGNNSKAAVVVDWEIYNSLEKRVVFKFSTEGFGMQPNGSGNSITTAFEDAVDRVLAKPGFMWAVQVRENLASQNENSANSINYWLECACDSGMTLPQDIDRAMMSVTIVRTGTSIASGVMIANDGFMLTAAHVVSGLNSVKVQLRSGLLLDGTVLRVDVPNDIALIRVTGAGHICLPLSTDAPNMGADLYAIGTPLGTDLSFSVSKGIVSGLRRFDYSDYIQTDASLNSGNSGGPLLNTKGEIVGIVSWKIVGLKVEGLAFGVPSAAIRRLLGISQRVKR